MRSKEKKNRNYIKRDTKMRGAIESVKRRNRERRDEKKIRRKSRQGGKRNRKDRGVKTKEE